MSKRIYVFSFPISKESRLFTKVPKQSAPLKTKDMGYSPRLLDFWRIDTLLKWPMHHVYMLCQYYAWQVLWRLTPCYPFVLHNISTNRGTFATILWLPVPYPRSNKSDRYIFYHPTHGNTGNFFKRFGLFLSTRKIFIAWDTCLILLSWTVNWDTSAASTAQPKVTYR